MFNIFKVLEIKFTYENQLTRLMLNSVWINLVSLASVYYSLDSLLKGDLWVLPFYIGGSVLGKWIAMTQMENLESKLFFFFKTKGSNGVTFVISTLLTSVILYLS